MFLDEVDQRGRIESDNSTSEGIYPFHEARSSSRYS
jgi:hypothetical protein